MRVMHPLSPHSSSFQGTPFSDGKRRFAEEYKQRVAAHDWATAHQLFAEELAPRWWLAGQHLKLRSQLQPLLKAAQEARAQVNTAQWQIGAELYATYFDVEVGTTLTWVR